MNIKGQEQIAAVFGVAPKTIVEWQEQGFPIAVQGQRGIPSEYETQACIAWYVQRELAKAGAETARDRLARLQADEVEMRLQERKGLLIPVEKIEPAWLAMVTAARNFLRSEPDRLAHLLEATDGLDAKRDLLAETFDEFLSKLSSYDISDDDGLAPADEAGVPEAGAPAEDLGSGLG